MTSRKKRVLLIQIVIFIFASFLIYITYYNKKIPEKTADNLLQSEKKKTKEELQSNTFDNVEYKGIDLNGNRYVLKSESADFESSMPELVNMKVMVAIFYFKDGSVLSVKGDYGTYNNKTKDMEFRENIKAEYKDNYLYADNLDYYNSRSSLSIYGNVKTESIQGNIMADNLEFDLDSKTFDISMFDKKNEVKVKLKN